jgi:acyl carrier protein
MTHTEILNQLQSVFDDIFLDPVTVTAELSANDVPEWDSLIHVSLMVAVEKAFRIRFGVGEVAGTRNLGDLADLISRKIG